MDLVIPVLPGNKGMKCKMQLNTQKNKTLKYKGYKKKGEKIAQVILMFTKMIP